MRSKHGVADANSDSSQVTRFSGTAEAETSRVGSIIRSHQRLPIPNASPRDSTITIASGKHQSDELWTIGEKADRIIVPASGQTRRMVC